MDQVPVAHDDDAAVTKTTYDWNTLQTLTSTVDPGGLNLVTSYQYDAATGAQPILGFGLHPKFRLKANGLWVITKDLRVVVEKNH